MRLYTALGAAIGTSNAADLSARLSAWHDDMVGHERGVRRAAGEDRCDDECPHGEAPALWSEALETFGPRAYDLGFLRSRAREASRRWPADAGGATVPSARTGVGRHMAPRPDARAAEP